MSWSAELFQCPLFLYLPSLLCAYWTLATAAAAFALLPGSSSSTLRSAVLLSAARGKLCRDDQAHLGWLTSLTVPQSWFLHFYVAGTACNSCLLYAAWEYAEILDSSIEKDVCFASLVLLEVHLVRRMLETAYIMHYPRDAKMHCIAYIFGLSYYIVVPLSCIPSSMITHWKTGSSGHTSCTSWLTTASVSPQRHLGVCIFLAGNVLQFWSHRILANLQNQRPKSTIEKGFYQVPQGGPFYWVSCPHYLAEITIYTGLALFAGKELPLTLLILCWVVVNLLLAAQPTHRWYQQRFPDYPRNRKALVPYLY